MLMEGYAAKEIISELVSCYGYNENTAGVKLSSINKELQRCAELKAPEVAATNIARTNDIIDISMEEEDYKVALSAIAEQNRTCNVYTNKVEVKTDEPFTIKLTNVKRGEET